MSFYKRNKYFGQMNTMFFLPLLVITIYRVVSYALNSPEIGQRTKQ